MRECMCLTAAAVVVVEKPSLCGRNVFPDVEECVALSCSRKQFVKVLSPIYKKCRFFFSELFHILCPKRRTRPSP